jgi:signal transduction histidine kinase
MNTDKTNQTFEILAAANQKIQKLLKPDLFYALLIRPDRPDLYYPLIAEGDEVFTGSQVPWQDRPWLKMGVLPDQVIGESRSFLLEEDGVDGSQTNQSSDLGRPASASWLGVPLLSGPQAFGALVVEKIHISRAFGENGQKTLETIAQHVALALQNTWLFQRLQRKLQYLDVLNEIGQKIGANVHRDEPEILETIYREASNLPMDTGTMYIAFYDPDQDMVTFPLVYVDGKRISTPSSGMDWKPRRGDHRRTEWVIKKHKPHIVRTITEAQTWYQGMTKDYGEEVFGSWIGAPMLAGDTVLGMIAVRHVDEYKYDEDDLEVLQILAIQAAVAIQNFRLFTQKNNAEKLAMMSEISAEFVHRMNNLAGTIPARSVILRRKLNAQKVDDPKIIRELDAIDKDARQILDAAQLIKAAAVTPSKPVEINLSEAIDTALGRALAAQKISEEAFRFEILLRSDLPKILVDRNKFLDVMTNIIKNGLEAMAPKGGGLLKISTHSGRVKGKPAIEISVQDEGVGISATNLTRIFDLFFTTKPGGTGFGLWRDRFVIRAMDGEIVVDSTEGKGSTFKILIPIDYSQSEEDRGAKDE